MKDVAGLAEAKELLYDAVILPQKMGHLFTGKRQPFKGILMYGPPGTGKSFLAKALANEAELPFYPITASDLVSKWMGEGEKQVKQLFEDAKEDAQDGGGAIIFIDEVDSIAGARGEGKHESSVRLLNELLVCMDGFGSEESGVVVIAATNIPWAIDDAMKRRLEKRVYIPLPDSNARVEMFKLNMGDEDNNLTEGDFRHLALVCEGYSGSDIKTMTKDALGQPVNKMTKSTHFKKVIMSYEDGERHEKWMPCSPGDAGAKYFTKSEWLALGEKIVLPPVNLGDYYLAKSKCASTVKDEDLAKFRAWTAKFGFDGS